MVFVNGALLFARLRVGISARVYEEELAPKGMFPATGTPPVEGDLARLPRDNEGADCAAAGRVGAADGGGGGGGGPGCVCCCPVGGGGGGGGGGAPAGTALLV